MKHFFGDTAFLTGRSLRHITRSVDTIITTTIMPIAFMLLFVYVFGGAIKTGGHSYVNYLLTGILLITSSGDTIITTTIMQIAFMLLFVYVFGGAIKTGGHSYVNYLLPGILLIT